MSGPITKTTAYVQSAVTLQGHQLTALTAILSKKLNRQVTLSVQTDPSLLGGLSIRVDGRVIDRSVKKQLRDMHIHIRKAGAG